MSVKYLSLFSGIEAATVAWEPLGWQCLAVAEIEPFPAAVLAHHYPDVPNLGDVSKADYSPCVGKVDVLVGGSPCQAFSVAGLRQSLADPRGNLTLEFVRAADTIRPRYILWENVPGVLSTPDNAFGCFLGALVGSDAPIVFSDGWPRAGVVDGPARRACWRVLDAQFLGLAQRRERVFVVASAGSGPHPAEILLEWESLRRDTPPRREAGEGTAADVVPSLTSSGRGVERSGESRGQDPVVAMCLNAGGMGRIDGESETFIAHALRADGFDASEDGTGRGTPLVPVAFDWQSGGEVRLNISAHHTSALGRSQTPAVAFCERGREQGRTLDYQAELAYALANPASGGMTHSRNVMTPAMAVRRLTVEECESLQGFPRGYSAVPYRNKPAADGPRYRALGNSFAVPVVRWIGRRIMTAMEENR
jgi:DNA (cytosine-5)-methyltransferase 1